MKNYKQLDIKQQKEITGGKNFFSIPAIGDAIYSVGKGFLKGWNKGKKLSDIKF